MGAELVLRLDLEVLESACVSLVPSLCPILGKKYTHDNLINQFDAFQISFEHALVTVSEVYRGSIRRE